MALESNAATTEESTPPEIPSKTFLLPTLIFISSIKASTIFLGFQEPLQPQISFTKVLRIF